MNDSLFFLSHFTLPLDPLRRNRSEFLLQQDEWGKCLAARISFSFSLSLWSFSIRKYWRQKFDSLTTPDPSNKLWNKQHANKLEMKRWNWYGWKWSTRCGARSDFIMALCIGTLTIYIRTHTDTLNRQTKRTAHTIFVWNKTKKTSCEAGSFHWYAITFVCMCVLSVWVSVCECAKTAERLEIRSFAKWNTVEKWHN